MNRRDAIKHLAGLTILAACGDVDVTDPFCGYMQDGTKQNTPTTPGRVVMGPAASESLSVRSFGEFIEGLKAGHTAFFVAEPLYVTRPVYLNDYIPYNHFVLEGWGGFNGSSLVRNFDGPEPLLRATRFSDGKERHWEMRLRGITFEGNEANYPNGGPSLDFDYLQLSVIEDLRFQDHSGRPFVLGRDTINAIEFRDVLSFWNAEPGQLLNCSDFRIRGGSIEDHKHRNSGLEIVGPPRSRVNSYPGPGLIEDLHQEFSRLWVRGVDDLTYRGGYKFFSELYFEDCNGRFNFSSEGSWPHSRAFRNGKVIYPVRC